MALNSEPLTVVKAYAGHRQNNTFYYSWKMKHEQGPVFMLFIECDFLPADDHKDKGAKLYTVLQLLSPCCEEVYIHASSSNVCSKCLKMVQGTVIAWDEIIYFWDGKRRTAYYPTLEMFKSWLELFSLNALDRLWAEVNFEEALDRQVQQFMLAKGVILTF